jgi:anti-sigma-K factor RskA
VNTQEYISSGIIESYVLGLASNAERAEFEQLAALHPEVRAAREAFELGLEQHALSNAVVPPAAVKQKVWSEIIPAAQVTGMPALSNGQAIVRSMSMLRYMSAAAVILLVASTALNFYFYSQYRSSTAKYETLSASIEQLAKDNKVQQAKLDLYASSFRMMNDSNMAMVALKGVTNFPIGRSVVFWDKQTKDVYLQANNLPQPASDKQYQLWAIVDGVPVDAGVFDISDPYAVIKLKNIQRAQAFAITLENKGGSPAPHLEAMYVMGAVS